jgi:hypothetical protein
MCAKVNRRITIILLVILLFSLALMGYFIFRGKETLFTDPYKAISPDASIIIETADLQGFMNTLTTDKGLFGEIGKIKELAPFYSRLKYITGKLNNAGLKKLFNERTAILSFHKARDGKLQPLLTITLPREIRNRQIIEILRSGGINEIIESKTNGSPVLKLPYSINNKKDTSYIAMISGLMVAGTSEILIEEARNQVSTGKDVRNLPGFSRVLQASGRNVDKIYLNFANLPTIFKSGDGDGGKDLAAKISKLAGTAEGDIYISEDGLVLSGYTESVDSTEILYKYKFYPPGAFHTFKILPSSTALFETFILPPKMLLAKFDSTYNQKAVSLAARLIKYTGEEITRAYIDIKGRSVDDNILIIYELKDRNQAEQAFLEEIGTERNILYFEPDEEVKIPVYNTAFNGFTRVMLQGFAPRNDETYFAFYDNFMITGSSFATISKLLYDNLLNKTLANDLTYRDFESTLPSRAGYFFYCVPSRISDYLAMFLDDAIIIVIKANKNSIGKIQAAGYQFASSNGMIYNSLSVRFKQVAREESTTEWETLLDTVAGIKPFFFTNHLTGAKEIFIQDMKNNTYLINAAGRILWKVPLNERIVGTVYMVDYFSNGKYQLLFSGKNYLHLLDRNGNYVERYPVKLRSPSTNSLAVFDYDNNLNYRLFIAGEDKMIYSYDKTGNVVKGWKPFKTSGLVKSEISYFKISGKDYLVASDEFSIYLLDRSGNKRVNLKETVTKAGGSALRLVPGQEPYLICSSPDGTVQQIFFNGSIRKFTLKKFTVDHSFDIFDVDGDGFGEYIFIDRGILYLYDRNKSEIFTRKFDSLQLGGPINFIFSASDRKIGVFDATNSLIYLLNKNGVTMTGFPLRGASMFSIGKLSDKSGWNLIVGGTDRFLYNYKIDTEIK